MPDRNGELNKAIMALVYREYHAGRPATTMETVMDSKLAKEAGESVVFHHIADLGDTGLLNLHDISIKRSLGGQGRVVRGARPAISLTETGSRFVERSSEHGSSNEEDRLSIKPTAFGVPKNTSHSESSLLVAVMIPFQKEFDSVYETINKVCSKLGFTARKADDMWQDQTIIRTYSPCYTKPTS